MAEPCLGGCRRPTCSASRRCRSGVRRPRGPEERRDECGQSHEHTRVVQVVFFQVAGGRVVFDECVTVGEAIITTSEFGSADLWDATHTNISPSTLRERAVT